MQTTVDRMTASSSATLPSTLSPDVAEPIEQRLNEFNELRAAGMICKTGEFFPTGVHYPPITRYQPITEEQFFDSYVMPEDGKLDIYLHIPFCRTRCLFCHYPVRLGPNYESEKDFYLDHYQKELDLLLNRLGIDKFKGRSILVGGGTPTYLSLDQQERFLEMCAERIDMSEVTQYNYDVDPVTLVGKEGAKRLDLLQKYGVDRLTIGVQSLNEEVLKLMNRHHGPEVAIEAIRDCQARGIRLDIEFIFGYPGQNLENWIEVMEEAVSLDVDEIQLYRLKIDAYGDYQGPVKNLIEKNPASMPSNEEQIKMKAAAIAILARNGYNENLRRVFTRKREHYSHYADNQCCQLRDEIGAGLTSFSSLGDRFGLNTQNWDEYYSNIEAGRLPINRGIVRNEEEQIRWATILPLKNRDIYKPRFKEVTGYDIKEVFKTKFSKLKEYGLVEENDHVVVLTKKGAFFADEVVQQFEAPEYLPFPKDGYEDGPLNPYLDNSPF